MQNRAEADQDEYWVGTAIRIVKEHDRSGTIGRVRYDPGDLEVEVVWKHRVVADSKRMTFEIWKDAKPDQVSTNLHVASCM